jgi:hypothetical protein
MRVYFQKMSIEEFGQDWGIQLNNMCVSWKLDSDGSHRRAPEKCLPVKIHCVLYSIAYSLFAMPPQGAQSEKK